MSAAHTLRRKAYEYEVKAASEQEKDDIAQTNGEFPSPAPMLFATAAMILYEVAEALERDLEMA